MQRWISIAAVLATLLAGCRPAMAPPSLDEATQAATYEARGTVRAINPSRPSVVIAHENIPGYMEAMAMELDAADPHELADLRPGDVVTFRLSVTGSQSHVDRLRKTGETVPVPPPAISPPAELAPGALAPDCALVDSGGHPFHVSDFRGQTLAIAFIFTGCPLPDFCPRLSSQFAGLPQALAGGPDRWHLLSISFDSRNDTPERLAAYASTYHADPARWTFATGDETEILRFGAAFGLAVDRRGGGIEHNLRAVVLDPAGRVRRVFFGNQWSSLDLAVEIRLALEPLMGD